ncbi:MAG TPA: histidine--tRNA ligase [Ktedonobacteraceae bacterium]|jgi:histidyl-tRNA synthetase|nr:histidine--tRNA ligase [Ktedonobacteraceae bacterium]
MPEQFRALQGFRDVLPEEQAYWRFVEETAATVAHLYGYRRIETPLLEESAVFQRTSGEGTDIVDKEMYSFNDRADKEGKSQKLSLRPEGTAGVVRAYLEHGMFKLPQPVKVYYMSAAMFRHDKPQAGRYREHHQFGCEALGESDPAIDAEMIGLLYQVYTRLGLKNIQVSINSIGDQNCRPQYIETLRDYYRPLLDSCCDDCQVRFHKNPLRLLDCKEPQDQEKIANAPKISDYLCDACRDHFAAVQRFLGAYEVPFVHDALIVRGLDYYTRTVFEFTVGSKLALNGGGRYDGLAEVLGGRPTPGIGFGAGIERIILELKRQGVTPPAEQAIHAFVAYLGRTAELKNTAVEVSAELRRAGIKTEMSYGDRSPKAQMKQANASGAPYAIIVREDEQGSERIAVKHLQVEGMEIENKQVLVRRADLVRYLTTGEGETFASE